MTKLQKNKFFFVIWIIEVWVVALVKISYESSFTKFFHVFFIFIKGHYMDSFPGLMLDIKYDKRKAVT